MKYQNLFICMTEKEKEVIDKDIERYLIDKCIPAFSDLGRYRSVYLLYGNIAKVDGQKLFEDDLNQYIQTLNN